MLHPTEITLGQYTSYWFHRTPRRMLNCLSYYQFAGHLIGNNKKVLDVGCNEGIGTWVIAKKCGYAMGVDFDEKAIQTAKNNFLSDQIDFSCQDILKDPIPDTWDAVIHFDVIEHIYPENADTFLLGLTNLMKPEGMMIVGTPSLIGQQFASAVSRKGHVNVYDPKRLEETMRKYFEFVFLFSGHDEVIHPTYLPMAHYLFAVGCKKKACNYSDIITNKQT